jgi:hypothetical protein
MLVIAVLKMVDLMGAIRMIELKFRFTEIYLSATLLKWLKDNKIDGHFYQLVLFMDFLKDSLSIHHCGLYHRNHQIQFQNNYLNLLKTILMTPISFLIMSHGHIILDAII